MSYNKKCIFCNQDIMMDNPSGKWLPYNLDSTAHECKGKQPQTQPQTQQPQKEVQEQQNKSSSTLTLEELDARLKKVELSQLGSTSSFCSRFHLILPHNHHIKYIIITQDHHENTTHSNLPNNSKIISSLI